MVFNRVGSWFITGLPADNRIPELLYLGTNRGLIMIEKLDKDCGKLQKKINELVDAVNELQKHTDRLSCAILDLATPDGENKALKSIQAEPADPYAEQRKWIGKLCKFWDYDDEEKWFSKLEYIDKNSPYPYCASGDWWYKHCEPVKPDDDIIYKGANNE